MPRTVLCVKGEDGRLSDLWCDGWHVELPSGGAPVAKRGEPPAGVEPVEPDLVEQMGVRSNVEANGWLVSFGDGEPQWLPPDAPPHTGSGGGRFYGRRFLYRKFHVDLPSGEEDARS